MQNDRPFILMLLKDLGLNPNLIHDMNRAVELIKTKATLNKDEEVLEILHFAGYIY